MASRSRPAARPAVRAAALLITGTVSAAGCAAGGAQATPHGAAASTRPAAKETCDDVVWEPPPELHVTRTSRELVGFSPTLLGVYTTWAGDGFTAETVAGGYVDDLTEAYDDLHVTGSLTLGPGVEAEVLHGQLLEAPVLAVIWRDPADEVPCDVHALVITGAASTPLEGTALEDALLRGLH